MQGRVYQPTPGEGQPWSIAYHSADWVSGARRRISRSGFSTQEEAEAALARAVADAEAGAVAVRPAQRSVTEFLEGEWLTALASKDLGPEVVERYRSVVEQWIVPHVGAMELGRLTPKTIEGLYDTLRAPSTTTQGPEQSALPNLRLTAEVLRMALGQAVSEGLIPRNPADVVDPGPDADADPAPSRASGEARNQ
ncbi:MAG: hypothetical protein DLM54_11640 [Acidimicrobiales bacterium]|nr:MAG: hypothetical protein DLM54_11640 [Acidimicrobiales bacterium]